MDIDKALLGEFERTIDTAHPEQNKIPIKVLGYGEISIVFEITGDKYPIAYKRLPIFEDEAQVTRHVNAYKEYTRLLRDEISIDVPWSDAAWFPSADGRLVVLYCAQAKLDPSSIGNSVIHAVDESSLKALVWGVMRELKKVWAYNKRQSKIQVGIDGQVSNWSVPDLNSASPVVDPGKPLSYIDTSTPMYRVDGNEAMEATLLLKSAPGFIRGLLTGMAKEVVDRYYDFRLVANDFIANFYKEQMPSSVPVVLEKINEFFATEASEFGIKPFTVDEIKQYYAHDKKIWVLFQNMRRFDRFVKVKLLRKPYDFYLPEKIKR
jgi:hypothetical protein